MVQITPKESPKCPTVGHRHFCGCERSKLLNNKKFGLQ
ncbi:hypothetical protein FRUB_03492 [Fimbriiglobus ruber]|uniref:Uncharacterized protein n=1 Tax=Fimbriiglobus ruber TaxID=1908690 RepID=A0A225DS58_9BACT|nr:hypothetical protein FRUB_03492 [Fimbriiglobus ruber]